MRNAKTHKGPRFIVQCIVQTQDAETVLAGGQKCPLEVVIGHTYLPAFISEGKLYVQAPLGHVVQAVTQEISALFGNLEVGVSGPGSPAFSLDSDGRPLPSAWLAESDLVRSDPAF